MSYCGECGNKLDDNVKFCGRCGNKLFQKENSEFDAELIPRELKRKKEQLILIAKFNINPVSRVIDSFSAPFASSKLGKAIKTSEMINIAFQVSPLLGAVVGMNMKSFIVCFLEDGIMIIGDTSAFNTNIDNLNTTNVKSIGDNNCFKSKWEDCKKHGIEISFPKKNFFQGLTLIDISFNSNDKKYARKGVIVSKARMADTISWEAFELIKSKINY
jgi:hypothetical protein